MAVPGGPQTITVRDKDAFLEQQQRIVELSRLLQGSRAKHNAAEREKKRAQLTLTELTPLPAETRTYKAMGKAFVFSPLGEVQNELKEKITKSESDSTTFQNQIEHLEKRLIEGEKKLQDLIIPTEGNEKK